MQADLLFLHPGGFNPEGLQGPFFPMGLIGLASLIEKKGFKPAIVNLVVEKILKPDLSTKDLIKEYSAPIIGVDLHWFVHSYEALELARICRDIHPSSKIILGGLTASLFDEEILQNFPFIDVIVRGDAEIPLVQYISYIIERNKIDFENIPNVTYKDSKGNIRRTNKTYKIVQKDLDELDFLRFDFVNNWATHLKLINKDYIPLENMKRTSDLREYYNPLMPLNAWVVYTGRGCPHKCSFCGGSSTAYKNIFGRSLILRSPEKIADDVLRYNKVPIDMLYFPHSPLITEKLFHRRILEHIKSKLIKTDNVKLNLGFIFEDCPFRIDHNILESYLKIFDGRKSIFRLYIADYEEDVSQFNNFPINIPKINKLLDFLRGRAHVVIGAMIGLPGQTYAGTKKMAKYLSEAKKKEAIIMIYNAELQPGSELSLFPNKYKIDLELRSFMDYYRFLKNKKDKKMIYGYTPHNNIGIEEQREILLNHIG